MMRRYLAIFILLSGCATAPPLERAQLPLPPIWQGSRHPSTLDTAALAQWWKRLNDPVLTSLIERSLAQNPDLRSSLSSIAEARARRGLATSGFFPTLSGKTTGRTQRSKNHELNLVTESENYTASLDASWEIDLFGKQYMTRKAASADLQQTEENYRAAQVSLAAEVAEAYLALRSAETQISVTEENLRLREETVRITRWRVEAGQENDLSLQQALSTLEQARSALPSLRQTQLQGRNQLTLLCGLTPGALDRQLRPTYRLPSVPARLAIGIPADTLRQRPDIRAAEARLLAADARTSAAIRERFPTLSLSGTIGVDALKAGRLFSPSASAASLLGTLAAPIFDAGRIRQNVTIQSEQAKQALLAYESAVLKALSEVENALIAVEQTQLRLASLAKANQAAREAARLATQQYEAGTVDLLVVIEAQRTLWSLEEQQVITRANQITAHIQLYKALGGGWSR